MQVFGFHVYNLYSFPSILNGNVNKCSELVSSDIFCLFPLQHDSSLMCKMKVVVNIGPESASWAHDQCEGMCF